MEARQGIETLVAALIDFENVGLDSIQWLFDQISDVGRIIVKRAYADWSSAGNKRDQLLELGIEPIQQFHSGSKGKNSSDIRLAIDAIDLLHQSPVNTFVIVSSDSDFIPLVNKLRAAGKTVMGAGRQTTAPRTLVISCDKYYFLGQSRKAAVSGPSPEKRSSDALLIRAVQATMDEEGKVIGSKLYQTMQRLDPSFDFRALGYTTFARYLRASPAIKVGLRKGGGDVMVELADTAPSGPDQPQRPADWDRQIDTRWGERLAKYGHSVTLSAAAKIAAEVIGVSKLKDSQYKTIRGLLESSEYLQARWSRQGNSIVKRLPSPGAP
ncbi:MAG TPA: NYN domain-containing protein [Dehalococcoidales bacterium]|nr:NYN domain-containing protein [Dehalococcoidales bacterium]